MKPILQWLADLWLECRIGAYYRLFLMSWSPKHLARMNALLRQRSPQRVAKMEKSKGLA